MFCLDIAGHTIAIKTAKQKAMLDRMPNYKPFIIPCTDRVLLTVDMDSTISLPHGEPFKIFEYPLTEDCVVLRIYETRYILSVYNDNNNTIFTIDCPLNSNIFYSDLATQSTAPPFHIIDHLLSFGFSVAAAPLKTLLIHASTIVYDGYAVMFLGESGTGKSTHSRMWLENIHGSSLLNDDAPAIRIATDGTVAAHGTPWSGKTPCYKKEAYPLKALARIKQAPHNKIIKLPVVEALGAVLPSSLPSLQQHDSTFNHLCDMLSDILTHTSVYRLECLPDADSAHTSHAKIFG